MTLTFSDVFGPIPDANTMIRVSVRLVTALVIGGLIGLQREMTRHSAGLRTHILVSMGAAVLVICGQESGMTPGDVSRIVQGIVTGIGFLGGGAILKLTAEHEIRGLTTAAGIWMTAACGVAAGLGRLGVAIIGVILALLVLIALRAFEQRLGSHRHRSTESKQMRIDTQDDGDN